MNKRIELIIEREKLSPSQFADEIGVTRAGISHLLSGRNKPSLDVVQKILIRFQNINTDWLLRGIGNMYRIEEHAISPESVKSAPMYVGKEKQKLIQSKLFSDASEPAGEILTGLKNPAKDYSPSADDLSGIKEHRKETGKQDDNDPNSGETTISRSEHPYIQTVILIYSNKTFELFRQRI